MSSNNPYRRHMQDGVPTSPPPARNASDSSASGGSIQDYNSNNHSSSNSNTNGSDAHSPRSSRQNSVTGAPMLMTRSLGYGAVVSYERPSVASTAPDSDLVFVTVRLRNEFRRASVVGADDLPSRPAQRSFLSRINTRISATNNQTSRHERYKALKMPRGDFKRYFVRDAQGNYAGSEPERMWDEDELMRAYGEYQDLPLSPVRS